MSKKAWAYKDTSMHLMMPAFLGFVTPHSLELNYTVKVHCSLGFIHRQLCQQPKKKNLKLLKSNLAIQQFLVVIVYVSRDTNII